MPLAQIHIERLFTASIPILWVLSDLCTKVFLISCDRDLRSIRRRAETGIGNALGGDEKSDAITEEADRPLRFSDRSLCPRCGRRADIRRSLGQERRDHLQTRHRGFDTFRDGRERVQEKREKTENRLAGIDRWVAISEMP